MQNKILGLDLGISSIGWALVTLPETDDLQTPSLFEETVQGANIIAMGTKIIPLDSADEKEFKKGKAIEVNQNRTKKRQMRRGYYRYKMRRIALKNALKEKDMLDESLLSTEKLPKIQLWELRHKAVTDKISLTELGRVLLHLNQKRGYNQKLKGQADEQDTSSKSQAEDTNNETTHQTENSPKTTKKEGYKDKITKNSKELGNKTIGQYVYEQLRNNPDYRTKDIVYYRRDYENEFHCIINKQKSFYPEVLTDDFIAKLYHIIYHQRPLKSQKKLVKKCSFSEIYVKQIHNKNEENSSQVKEENKKENKLIKVASKVAPKSSPLAEYKKILEAVNNLEIREYEKTEITDETSAENAPENENASRKSKKRVFVKIIKKFPLNQEERKTLIDALQNCEKMSKTEILKLLGYSTSRFTINCDKLEGNKTRAKIISILGENHSLLQFNLKKEIDKEFVNKETGEITVKERISSEVENEPFYQLWHVIYSIKDIDECKKALIKRFNLDEKTAEKLAQIEFTKGNNDYTNISARVIRHIIPYLEQGYQYNQAMEKAGYKHSKESRTKDENQQRQLADTLNLIPKNALRQPVVEKILNQMIHLVNEIIAPERGWVTKEERENGTFRIHIELARELKANKKEREKIHSANKKRTDDNKKIAEYLTKKGITPSRNNIIRYRLFRGVNTDKNEKTHGICLYSGKTFEFNQVFDDKIVDKDHIIPQSIYPDDSQGNFVLVYKDENKTKSNQTAYDYMYLKGNSAFEQYLQRIQEAFDKGAITGVQVRNLLTTIEHNPKQEPHCNIEIKGKGKNEEYFIGVTKLDEEKGFAARDMRETSYITKEAKRILTTICREVQPTTGAITAELRNLWGYNDILPQWHIERLHEMNLENLIEQKVIYDENNQQTYKQTIKDWSKRDDHRHHAIDALIVACTTKSIIQRINTLHAKETREAIKEDVHSVSDKTSNTRMNTLRKYLRKKQIFSPNQVKQQVDNILISYKPGKKVAVWGKNKTKDGKWNPSKRSLIPRGQLHKENYYGRITTYKLNSKKIDEIIHYLTPDKQKWIAKSDRKAIFEDKNVQYYLNTNNTQLLVKYLKNTIKSKKINIYEPEQKYVLRYNLSGISKEDASKPDDFIDKPTYECIKNAFSQNGKDNDKIKEPVLNVTKKYIKSLRMRKVDVKQGGESDTYYPLRYNEKGEPITFVLSGNNHHVAIYRDETGKLHEHLCTFWHAVERKKYDIPVVITSPQDIPAIIAEKQNLPTSFISRLPDATLEYVLSMQQNEMFILGMKRDEIEQAIKSKNYKKLSKCLYRVQKLTSGEYTFRHHLATRVDDKKSAYVREQGKKLSINKLQENNPIKVRINRLGEITEIAEHLSESEK